MDINILGTEYKLIETTGSEDPRLEGAHGWCGSYEKTILVEREIFTHAQGGAIEQTRIDRSKFIKRHEITHAFFNESGLDDYSQNEQLVSWIARQFPKMLEVFEKTNAI